MIKREYFEKAATKQQTNIINVVREYAQLTFLSFFYQLDETRDVLFKGGTALRLAFRSPRYSEDLDFSAPRIYQCGKYEDLLQEVMIELDREGFAVDIAESKAATGGCLAILDLDYAGESFKLKTDVSLRREDYLERELVVIESEYYPAFTVSNLKTPQLLREKVIALLARQKPRDFFDLYFILRSKSLRPDLRLTKKERKEILEVLEEQSERKLEADLKELLPQSFHGVITDFPATLRRELG